MQNPDLARSQYSESVDRAVEETIIDDVKLRVGDYSLWCTATHSHLLPLY